MRPAPRYKYSASSNSGVCYSCAAGKFSPNGQQVGDSSCIACPAGKLSGVGAAICAVPNACQAGKYRNRGTMGSCSDCPIGRFGQSKTTSADLYEGCAVCPPGKSSSAVGLTSALQCLAKIGGSQNAQCVGGTWTLELSATATCTKCDEGKFNEAFSTSARTAYCKSCPTGKTTDGQRDSIKACYAAGQCPMGKYREAKDVITKRKASCKTCPAGRYAPGASAAVTVDYGCVMCAAGRTTPPGSALRIKSSQCSSRLGGTSSSRCGVGKYTTSSSAFASCLACAIGYYNQAAYPKLSPARTANCIACPSGKTTSGTGLEASASDCLKSGFCPLGW